MTEPIASGPAEPEPLGPASSGSHPDRERDGSEPTASTQPLGSQLFGTLETDPRPLGREPDETTPLGSDPADTRPLGSDPADTRPLGSDPADTRPLGSTPVNPYAAPQPDRTEPVEPPPRGIRLRTIIFGVVLLVIAGSLLLVEVSSIRIDTAAVALALLIGAGGALVAGGVAAAVREARGGPGA